ncbi:hypothetical protein G7046_g4473 [Stylonectria norvegica]|nr:hypothetical protein G7046_g4473 [Stylonectria norvegica]
MPSMYPVEYPRVVHIEVITLTEMRPADYDTTSDISSDVDEPKYGTPREWFIVLGGFLSIMASFGFINSVGLIQAHLEKNQLRDFTPSQIGWIPAITIFLALATPVATGPLYDRHGHRWLLALGSVFVSLGMLFMSLLGYIVGNTTFVVVLLVMTWGIMCGVGMGAISVAVTGVINATFGKRCGMACGIVFMGSSVGGVLWPLLLRDTLERWGWSPGLGTLCGVSTTLLVFGNVMLRRGSQGMKKNQDRRLWSIGCLKKLDFVLMTLSLAVFQFVVMGIVGTLPSWGMSRGFDRELMFNVVAAMNSGAALGRLAICAASDRFGRLNTVIVVKASAVVILFAIFLNVGDSAPKFFVFAPLWGFTAGATLSTMGLLVGQLCQADEEFGMYYGMNSFIVSLGGLLAVPLSAMMLKALGTTVHIIVLGTFCAPFCSLSPSESSLSGSVSERLSMKPSFLLLGSVAVGLAAAAVVPGHASHPEPHHASGGYTWHDLEPRCKQRRDGAKTKACSEHMQITGWNDFTTPVTDDAACLTLRTLGWLASNLAKPLLDVAPEAGPQDHLVLGLHSLTVWQLALQTFKAQLNNTNVWDRDTQLHVASCYLEYTEQASQFLRALNSKAQHFSDTAGARCVVAERIEALCDAYEGVARHIYGNSVKAVARTSGLVTARFPEVIPEFFTTAFPDPVSGGMIRDYLAKNDAAIAGTNSLFAQNKQSWHCVGSASPSPNAALNKRHETKPIHTPQTNITKPIHTPQNNTTKPYHKPKPKAKTKAKTKAKKEDEIKPEWYNPDGTLWAKFGNWFNGLGDLKIMQPIDLARIQMEILSMNEVVNFDRHVVGGRTIKAPTHVPLIGSRALEVPPLKPQLFPNIRSVSALANASVPVKKITIDLEGCLRSRVLKMGQTLSDEQPSRRSHEELTQELAKKFKDKCFTSLEFYSLKDVFKNLADQQDSIRYLKEDTIARYLEIPDILGTSPVIFQMVSYLGAFPFLQHAPVVLELPQMIMVVVIMTERYRKVLARGSSDRTKLLFKSMAVYDRKEPELEAGSKPSEPKAIVAEPKSDNAGFVVDEAGDDSLDDEDDEDDDLVLTAFELLDIKEAVQQGHAPTFHGAAIPTDNFRKLVMLLLLAAPLDPQESLALYSHRLVGDELESLRWSAECVLASFVNAEKATGIKYSHFKTIIPVLFPFLFNGFNGLFEHFLFSKTLDFSKQRGQSTKVVDELKIAQPLLPKGGEILNESTLSQISFFLPGSDLFRRVRLLYSGNEAGFSMGSFETKVFNWQAPTLLLVSGTRLGDVPEGGQETTFAAALPPRRFPHGSKSDRLTFGVYVKEPWKHTHRECFGDSDTVLFQLEPVHDVFPASALNKDYVSFTKPPGNHPLLSFGCPHPKPTQAHRKAPMLSLGPVSLLLDDSFEFGVFNHDYTSRGGAFRSSVVRKSDFQDRFQIESLEVWGCGGDAEAKAQAERWAWEEREAESRRKVNLGTGDIQADRALLEMAGIIGGSRSGGSMG